MLAEEGLVPRSEPRHPVNANPARAKELLHALHLRSAAGEGGGHRLLHRHALEALRLPPQPPRDGMAVFLGQGVGKPVMGPPHRDLAQPGPLVRHAAW
jgi:hypothetical protein